MIKIICIEDSAMAENAYIVYKDGCSDCVVIDAGMSGEELESTLTQKALNPVALLCTHGHFDHIYGTKHLREVFPGVPAYIGAKDADKFEEPRGNLSADFGLFQIVPAAEKTVTNGEVLDLAGIQIEVRDTPGHSAGHVVYIIRDDSESKTMVFCGDVLFAGSIGRSDFYDGDPHQLIQSIEDVILTLPDDTIVYSGHGPATTVGRERVHNPYF